MLFLLGRWKVDGKLLLRACREMAQSHASGVAGHMDTMGSRKGARAIDLRDRPMTVRVFGDVQHAHGRDTGRPAGRVLQDDLLRWSDPSRQHHSLSHSAPAARSSEATTLGRCSSFSWVAHGRKYFAFLMALA